MRALSERILRANELERWCQEHAIGDGRLVALCARHAVPEALDDDSLEALNYHNVRGSTAFRRVQLATAGIIVVDALNWYFPAQLTAQMRATLETTDIPFGRAIATLRPKRRTFFVQRSTPQQLVDAQQARDAAGIAFEHRAVVHTDEGMPLAVVHERFRIALALGVRGESMVA